MFEALNREPEAGPMHPVRRILTRALLDTNFCRTAEEVTAAIEKVGV